MIFNQSARVLSLGYFSFCESCNSSTSPMRSPCVPRAFPRVFGSCFLTGFPMNSLMVPRWVPAIFAVRIMGSFLVCETARFLCAQWYISFYFTLQVSCSFHVFFLPFSVLCFSWPSPVRSDIRNPCDLSWFTSGFPPTLALHSLWVPHAFNSLWHHAITTHFL